MNLRRTSILLLACIGLGTLPSPSSAKEEELFVAKPFTAEGLFTRGVEGPACDREGNVYAVAFGSAETIGKITPDGKASAFVSLPDGSAANGIVFDRAGKLVV